MDQLTGKKSDPAESKVAREEPAPTRGADRPGRWHARWKSYLLAVVLTTATLWIRLALAHFAGDVPILILFVIPIIVSAYVGGLGPGLLSTVLAALETAYYLLPPLHSFAITKGANLLPWMILAGNGTLISVLMESLHRARAELQGRSGEFGKPATERKVRAGFALALACLGVIGIASYFSVERFRADAEWVQHTEQVISSLHRLIGSAEEAEASQRGFIITEKDEYLAAYTNAVQNVDSELRGLRSFTADSREQQLRLDALVPVVQQRIKRSSEVIGIARTEGFNAAREAVISDTGKVLQDRLRTLIAQMEDTERAVLLERDALADRAGSTTKAIIVLGGLFAFAFCVVALFVMGQDFGHARQAEYLLRRSRDQLETRVRVRTAELAAANESIQLSEQRLRLVLEGLGEQMFVGLLDVNGVMLLANRPALEIAALRSEDALGRPLGETYWLGYSEAVRRRTNAAVHSAAQGQGVRYDEQIRVAEGQFIWIDFSLQPLRDESGKITFLVPSGVNITARKQAEEQIHKLNAELEQRVAERTAQLEAANQELEAFSYSISHDLRAPLRAVNGFAGIVLEDYGPLLPEDGRLQLERIRKAGERMGELIDDLLDFSRFNRQPLHRQTVDHLKLVQEVLAELQPQCEGRPLELRIGKLPACEGDPALLKQVWINLLSNAIKYSRGRNPATVEVGCDGKDGRNIYFVRDNGAGFDMQYAHKLFGVFQRLHRADEFEGTGVGLAIVQRIIHRHDGQVWVEAEEGRGATFYFTLDPEKKHERSQRN